jgi:7-carboxy-7-deazaguanine synthase
MLQTDLPALAKRLLGRGLDVVIETGGSLPLKDLPDEVTKVMDIKTPGAFRGEEDHGTFATSRGFLRTHLHYPNLDLLSERDQVKFVLCDRDDYVWALAFVAEHRLVERTAAVLFSPVHPGLSPEDLVSWVVEDQAPVRLNLQLHKYIWGDEARGV